MKYCETGILGGGIAGLSLAYFLEDRPISILERNTTPGGLARSFNINGLYYDIGPHLIFSKNAETLKFLNNISDNDQHKRSNKIYHKGNFVTYPFENYLYELGNKDDIDYCLTSFLNNKYENLDANNMLAFFLKTFGEGITRLYLQPYNEKIWKFDPSMMNTKMVERIPTPPKQDIIDGGIGKYKDGYVHQLFFNYPKEKGIQSLPDKLRRELEKRETFDLFLGSEVQTIEKSKNGWFVRTNTDEFQFGQLLNCMPLPILIRCLKDAPEEIKKRALDLKSNSIYVVIINVKEDYAGNNFSFTIASKDVIFHRINKLDFMGSKYHIENTATFLAEITFMDGDLYSKMESDLIIQRCIQDMIKIGFIKKPQDVNFTDIKKEGFAYVIYDLKHKENTHSIMNYLNSIGIQCTGRAGEFEYLNIDRVIEHSQNLAKRINNIRR